MPVPVDHPAVDFDDAALAATLDGLTDEALDALPFGAIAITDRDGVVLDYVFTFRLRRVPVRLRLLHRTGSPRPYLAVVPR